MFNLNKYFLKKKKFKLKTLIIAEISANHSGDKKKFLSLIKSAAKNGADLVKIQTYEAKDITLKNARVHKTNLWKLYTNAETPFKWHKDAFTLAKKLNIELFSTPFSVRAVKFLEKFKVKLYKISSFEITDLLLIDEIAKTKKPVILSTGMATIKEIQTAIKHIKKYHSKIILLHCVSGYPTLEKNINLSRFEFLKKKFNEFNIGLSDHTDDINSSIACCGLGACLIEKHYIDSSSSKSLDSKFSINPEKLKKLIMYRNLIFYTNKANSKNLINRGEEKSKLYRRSIYLIKNLKKGDKLTLNNISTFRPLKGVSSSKIFNVLGKRVNKNKKSFSPLMPNDYY